jgi:hypothetical protein
VGDQFPFSLREAFNRKDCETHYRGEGFLSFTKH